MVPGLFLSGPFSILSLSISYVSLSLTVAWSITVSLKRERRIDVMPGFRYLIFSLHWVPALIAAIRNILADQPVVWVKTVHHGHGIAAVPQPAQAAAPQPVVMSAREAG